MADRQPARHGRRPRATAASGVSTVDLHTHTLRSDGVLQPVELVRAAAAAGVTTLAITDHDTLAAYRELVLGRAMPAPIELIPGVEINALPTRFAVGDGPVVFNAAQIDIDPATGRALAIERIQRLVEV